MLFKSILKNFIYFSPGEEVSDIEEKFLSIIIHEDKLYFINQNKEIGCYSITSEPKIIKVATTGLWSWDETPPKIPLIDKSIYVFSKRKVFKVNQSNGRISETVLPIGLNNKYISHLVDEFQINTNTFYNNNFGDSVVVGYAGGDSGGGGGDGGN